MVFLSLPLYLLPSQLRERNYLQKTEKENKKDTIEYRNVRANIKCYDISEKKNHEKNGYAKRKNRECMFLQIE